MRLRPSQDEGCIGSGREKRIVKGHGVPDLRWNDQLAAQAQAWAERVARQAHISYKELSGIGENITFFPRDLDPEASLCLHFSGY
ncbi:unnamed protein product [Strongylus vulgaris]|uniref:SCP domain-containing protein n=1 Tax=Strongylus vulgaris TaxID=40348 RepID=A0A3P7J2W2_STRVU|nr:unnamed protein product [Strongylus vulgaris]